MNTTPTSTQFRPWLIAGLACLTLVFPLLSLLLNYVGGSPASIGAGAEWIWLMIAVIWILVVWLTRTPHPLATLVLTGTLGGIFTVIIVSVIQQIFSGSADLLARPSGIVAIVALSTLGGTICGLIAWALQSATRGKNQ